MIDNNIKNNKDTPIPHIRTSMYVPGIEGNLFEVRHFFYAAKHKDHYKLKDRYYLMINKIDSPQKTHQKLLDDTKEFIKKGRYTDYFFVSEPIKGIYDNHL